MRRFTITFDYLCPFARNVSEVVIRALDAGAPFEVDFRAFSLSQVHFEEDATPILEAQRRLSGVLALQWGLPRKALCHAAYAQAPPPPAGPLGKGR